MTFLAAQPDVSTFDTPSVWSGLMGHSAQRLRFERAVARQRLTQAYLFLGPASIGKRSFARRLAQCLLCQRCPSGQLEACQTCNACRMFQRGSHPDFLELARDSGSREIKINQMIGGGDDGGRGSSGFCHDLTISPLPGSRKVAIVDGADELNEAAANAFLKTLEEPPAGAVLFLIASQPEGVLPTIRSRCQLVRFAPLSTEVVAELLVSQSLQASPEDLQWAASLSEGSLETARQLLDTPLRELREQIRGTIGQISWSGQQFARSLAATLEKATSEVPEQRRLAQWILRFTAECLAETLRQPPPEPANANRLRQAGTMLERLQEAEGQLHQNIGVSLVLEATFGDLSGVRLNR